MRGGDNDFNITVTANDVDGTSESQNIVITVTDVDENDPVFISSNAVSIVENTSGTIYLALANETVTFSIGDSKDEEFFVLSDQSIGFISAPDFENPLDQDADNDYAIDVTATDNAGNSTTIEVIITVYDENDSQPMGELAFEETSNSIDPVSSGSMALSDVDSDGNIDLFLTGLNSLGQKISKLYLNDGAGVFTEKTGTSFSGVSASAIAFADIDGNEHDDLLITGLNSSSSEIAEVYTNDGSGSFTLIPDTPFQGISNGSVTFSDIEGDNDEDVLLIGLSSVGLYSNNGEGIYTEISGTPFPSARDNSIHFFDADGVDNEDIFITGSAGRNEYGNLYINNGSGFFTENTGSSFAENYRTSVSSSDIDNDGDLDLLVNGRIDVSLYTNDGTGNFTAVANTPIDLAYWGSTSFADVDNDGDVDLLISGFTGYVAITKLYLNDGNGMFSELNGTIFEGIYFGSSQFADIDKDGDQDVLVSGITFDGDKLFKTYKNIGDFKSPEITSSSNINVEENTNGTVYIATADETVTFTLGSTKDEGLFTLTSDNKIRFLSAPDFENPQDLDENNVYLIDVIATDGSENSTTLEVSIIVTDLDENAPVFTSGSSASVNENVATSTVVYTATATDENTITFSLEGTDATSFNLGASSGELTFIVSPDFETKSSYSIILIATDAAGNSDDLAVTIAVNDLDDNPLGLPIAQGVKLYPNPVTDAFRLTGLEVESGQLLKVVSLTGKVVMFYHSSENNLYNTSNLKSGTYILVLVEGSGPQKQIGRLIKK